MTDILKDLAAELDVEVSPQFAARVQMAVTVEPTRSRRWIWGLAGAMTAAAMAVVWLVPRVGRTEPPADRAESPIASAGPKGPAYVLRPTPADVREPPAADLRSPAALPQRRGLKREVQPEVLVQSGQLEALRDLASRVREGSVDKGALPEKLIVSDDEEGGV